MKSELIQIGKRRERLPGSDIRVGRIRLPSMRLRISERRLLLFLVDVLILNGALVVAQAMRTDIDVTWQILLAPYKWYVTLTLVWMAAALFFNVYDLARAASTTHTATSSGSAALATVLAYTFIPTFTPPLQQRSLIYVFAILAWLGIVGWRVVYAQVFIQPWFKQRALVVGAGWAGRTLAEALLTTPADANPYRGTGYQLVGFVDDNPDLVGSRVADVPVLGGREVLLPMAEALQVDEIIVAITHRHAIADELFDSLLRCREQGLRITTMATLYERLLGRVPVEHVGRDLQTALPMRETAGERFYSVLKRLTDIGAALVGLVVLGIVAPLVALANAIASPGPLFYRQVRVGQGGREFEVVKFRSMLPDAEKHTGAVWAKDGDDRITPVGNFLRQTRLDEIPQVINVLRGEMSVIGPRPERPHFVDQLARTYPLYRARHAVRPGITGWAQVRYRYGSTVDDSRVKLEYDLYYVKQSSPLLDLRIILETVQVMLRFKGR